MYSTYLIGRYVLHPYLSYEQARYYAVFGRRYHVFPGHVLRSYVHSIPFLSDLLSPLYLTVLSLLGTELYGVKHYTDSVDDSYLDGSHLERHHA